MHAGHVRACGSVHAGHVRSFSPTAGDVAAGMGVSRSEPAAAPLSELDGPETATQTELVNGLWQSASGNIAQCNAVLYSALHGNTVRCGGAHKEVILRSGPLAVS